MSCPICAAHTEYPVFIFYPAKFQSAATVARLRDVRCAQRPYAIWRCRACQHGWCAPQPTQEELTAFYDGVYFDGFFEGAGYAGALTQCLAEDFKTKARFLHQHLAPEATLLDFGSGPGAFASYLRALGRPCVSVDVSHRAQADGQIGGEVVLPAIPSGHRYDAITCWNTLEHLPDPLKMLQHLHATLRPKGQLFLDTGNLSDPRVWWDRGASSWINPPSHLHYFSQASLRLSLNRCGFRVRRLWPMGLRAPRGAWYGQWLLARYLAHHPTRLLHPIRHSARRSPWGEVASLMLVEADA